MMDALLRAYAAQKPWAVEIMSAGSELPATEEVLKTAARRVRGGGKRMVKGKVAAADVSAFLQAVGSMDKTPTNVSQGQLHQLAPLKPHMDAIVAALSANQQIPATEVNGLLRAATDAVASPKRSASARVIPTPPTTQKEEMQLDLWSAVIHRCVLGPLMVLQTAQVQIEEVAATMVAFFANMDGFVVDTLADFAPDSAIGKASRQSIAALLNKFGLRGGGLADILWGKTKSAIKTATFSSMKGAWKIGSIVLPFLTNPYTLMIMTQLGFGQRIGAKAIEWIQWGSSVLFDSAWAAAAAAAPYLIVLLPVALAVVMSISAQRKQNKSKRMIEAQNKQGAARVAFLRKNGMLFY